MQHAAVAAEAQAPCIHVQSHVECHKEPLADGNGPACCMLRGRCMLCCVPHRGTGPDLAVDAGPEVLDVIREVHCAVVAAPTAPTTSHHTQRTPRRSAGLANPTEQRAKLCKKEYEMVP